jgi:hypothetical protein
VRAVVYVEGGGSGADSRYLQSRCRQGFRILLEKWGYKGRMPRLVASGSRSETYGDFKAALQSISSGDYVAMWIDSEEPLKDCEQAWAHLAIRDKWPKPAAAADDQVLFMTTCMETYIVADQAALQSHYGSDFQKSALPSLTQLEELGRKKVQEGLQHATRNAKTNTKKESGPSKS